MISVDDLHLFRLVNWKMNTNSLCYQEKTVEFQERPVLALQPVRNRLFLAHRKGVQRELLSYIVDRQDRRPLGKLQREVMV